MRLAEFNKSDKVLFAENYIAEISEQMLNESVNEGIIDKIQHSAQTLATNLKTTKGKPLELVQQVHANVSSRLDPNSKNKLMQFAKKHKKYIKPALIVAVVGATLLSSDAAAANDVIDSLNQLDSEQLSGMMEPVEVQVQGGETPVQGGEDHGHQSGEAQHAVDPNFSSDFDEYFRQKIEASGMRVSGLNGQLTTDQMMDFAAQGTGYEVTDMAEYMKSKGANMDAIVSNAERWLHDGLDAAFEKGLM